MSNLGNILKSKREELQKELNQVAKELKISQQYLNALEHGDYKKLPSYVHCYGFVKNYIRYLGLDEKEMMEIFHHECPKTIFMPKVKDQQNNIFNEVNKDTNKHLIKKRVLSYSIISLIFLIIAIVYLTTIKKPSQTDNSHLTQQTQDNKPVKSIDNTHLSIPTPVSNDNSIIDNSAILQQLSDNNSTTKENIKDNSSHLKSVKLSFYNTCWVNVKIDNKTELDFIAKPGFSKEFSFNEFFIIDIGDASAISISFNGQVIGGLGKPKESIKNLYFTVNDNKLIYSKKQ